MAIDDTVLRVYPAPGAQQTDIFFDAGTYSAFPHLAMLDGEEMIVAFRQAPREAVVRHTHPRSVITVMRSYDLGRSWDGEGSAQLAAGGGQEFSLLYAGGGRVVGALAKQHVVSLGEGARASRRNATSTPTGWPAPTGRGAKTTASRGGWRTSVWWNRVPCPAPRRFV